MAARESVHKGRVLISLIDSDSDLDSTDVENEHAFDDIVEYFGEDSERDDAAITRATAAAVAAAAPKKKHPLLAHRIDQAYRGMYDHIPKADVFVVIEEEMAVRDRYSAPIQLGLIAARDFAKGEPVTFYGGLPLPQAVIRRAKINNPMSHAAVIKGVDDALDGRPFAMMIRRPVPGSDEVLRRLINNGVEDLMPRLADGIYTAEEIRAFERSPFGYLCNSPGPGQKANLKMAHKKLNKLGLRQMPWLEAAAPIRKYDKLLWNYNNNDVFGSPVSLSRSASDASDASGASDLTYGSAAAIPSVPIHRQHRALQAHQGAMLDLSHHMSRIEIRQGAVAKRGINLR